jgi:hypothetical protein
MADLTLEFAPMALFLILYQAVVYQRLTLIVARGKDPKYIFQ